MAYRKEVFIGRLAVQKASLLTEAISNKIAHRKYTPLIIKEDDSPVTVGDFASQAVISNAIKHNFPDDEIVGEENSTDLAHNNQLCQSVFTELQLNDAEYNDMYPYKNQSILGPKFDSLQHVIQIIDSGGSKGGSKGRFWALDPIDGTKGFLRGGQYAICLALIVDGVVQVGIIGCPALPENFIDSQYKGGLFVAIKDHGSFYSRLKDTIDESFNKLERIQMNNSWVSISQITICEGFEKNHSSHDKQSKIKKYLGIPEKQTLNLDSQVKYCCLAKGIAELYLRVPTNADYKEKIWDHAAGYILVTESGGLVTDTTGKQLNFGEGCYLDIFGIIAGSKNIHPKVIEAINLLE